MWINNTYFVLFENILKIYLNKHPSMNVAFVCEGIYSRYWHKEKRTTSNNSEQKPVNPFSSKTQLHLNITLENADIPEFVERFQKLCDNNGVKFTIDTF